MSSPKRSSQSPHGPRIACGQCARAKTGCDKAFPTCTRCSEKKQRCEVRHARRRAKAMRRQDAYPRHNAGTVPCTGTQGPGSTSSENTEQTLASLYSDTRLKLRNASSPIPPPPPWQQSRGRALPAATWGQTTPNPYSAPPPASCLTQDVQQQADKSAVASVPMEAFYVPGWIQPEMQSVSNPQDAQTFSFSESAHIVDPGLFLSSTLSASKMPIGGFLPDPSFGASVPAQSFSDDSFQANYQGSKGQDFWFGRLDFE